MCSWEPSRRFCPNFPPRGTAQRRHRQAVQEEGLRNARLRRSCRTPGSHDNSPTDASSQIRLRKDGRPRNRLGSSRERGGAVHSPIPRMYALSACIRKWTGRSHTAITAKREPKTTEPDGALGTPIPKTTGKFKLSPSVQSQQNCCKPSSRLRRSVTQCRTCTWVLQKERRGKRPSGCSKCSCPMRARSSHHLRSRRHECELCGARTERCRSHG